MSRVKKVMARYTVSLLIRRSQVQDHSGSSAADAYLRDQLYAQSGQKTLSRFEHEFSYGRHCYMFYVTLILSIAVVVYVSCIVYIRIFCLLTLLIVIIVVICGPSGARSRLLS